MKRPEKRKEEPEGITTHALSFGWNECCDAWEEWLAEWLPNMDEFRDIIQSVDVKKYLFEDGAIIRFNMLEYAGNVSRAIVERLKMEEK